MKNLKLKYRTYGLLHCTWRISSGSPALPCSIWIVGRVAGSWAGSLGDPCRLPPARPTDSRRAGSRASPCRLWPGEGRVAGSWEAGSCNTRLLLTTGPLLLLQRKNKINLKTSRERQWSELHPRYRSFINRLTVTLKYHMLFKVNKLAQAHTLWVVDTLLTSPRQKRKRQYWTPRNS